MKPDRKSPDREPASGGASGGSGRFRVGDFLVEPSLNRIVRGRRRLSVEPKVMEVLVCLASRAGEVVSREELLAEVWPDAGMSEEALWHAISQLRKLFDDNRDARLVASVSNRGYRLITPTGAGPAGPDGEPRPGTGGP